MNGFDNPPWLDPLARGLSHALNRVIALDPQSATALAKLNGHVLEVRLVGPELSFFLIGTPTALCLGALSENEPSATLRATPATLAALLLNGGQSTPGKLDISGDALVARAFEQFMAALKPDWDEPVARLFGDVAGTQIASGARAFFGWFKDRAQGLGHDTVNWFKNESRDVVSTQEFEAFAESVEDLRDDLERLEARLKRRGV